MEAQSTLPQGHALCLLKAFHSLAVPRTQSRSEEAGASRLLPGCRALVMLPRSASACRVALPPVLATMDAGLQPARRGQSGWSVMRPESSQS